MNCTQRADRESDIERYFVRRVKSQGGRTLKFSSPSSAAVPDRILLLPGGRVLFIEFKAPGQKPRPLQQVVFRQFAGLGSPVTILDSREAVDRYLEEVIPDGVCASSVSGRRHKKAGDH